MVEKECSKAWPGGSGTVYVDVVVGEGHPGEIEVRVGTERVAAGSDRLERVPLGSADDLQDVSILVSALINPHAGGGPRTSLTSTFHWADGEWAHTCAGPEHGGDDVYIRSLYRAGGVP